LENGDCDGFGGNTPVFLLASVAYLFALGVIHLFVPRLEPAQIDTLEV